MDLGSYDYEVPATGKHSFRESEILYPSVLTTVPIWREAWLRVLRDLRKRGYMVLPDSVELKEGREPSVR